MASTVDRLSCETSTSLWVEELPSTLSPGEVFHRLIEFPHALFLDSAVQNPVLSRYSYLTADPFEWLQVRGRQRQHQNGSSDPRYATDPFVILADRLKRFHNESVPNLPPFQGGIAGFWGYDLCHYIERLPRPAWDEFQLPDMAVGLYDWVIAFDHAQDRVWLMATGLPETHPLRRRQRAQERLRVVQEWLQRPVVARSWTPNSPLPKLAPQWPVPRLGSLLSNFERTSYLRTIRRALDYIHEGDCFQVNIAQRLLHPLREPPWELYSRLRERNAAPFAGYLDLGDFAIASASPERFLRVQEGLVETRPIKGTRPRGSTPIEDQARREELLHSEKDRAENVMIVDLLRNDLGRVCRYGSVQVEAVCRLETYRYVHHLVSEVRGRLREGLGAIDLLRAAFPGGSVTGAPKVRAMEIIAELEPTARGSYCGSMGYLGFDGSMDTNILIRTFTAGRGWLQFPVGGGIVADSSPEREYDETWHKAEGLLRALR